MAKQILLDGKVLEGTDMYGEWGVHTFEGWWDSPDAKAEQTPRPGADGDFVLPVYYQARYPTLTGIFIAESESKMFDGMNRFSALLRNPGRLQVVGYGPTQWANVRRTSALVITPRSDRVCLWQAKVKAPDSRKYGNTRDFVLSGNGDVSVFHRGTYDAHATVVIRGVAPGGYTLWGPGGKNYTVTRPLVDGVPHRVEFNDGLLRVDGVLLPNAGQSDVWAIPPGPATTFGFSTSGTAAVTITVTDTFI